MNDSSFDEDFKIIQPGLILYDRFVMEEQFGWKMRELFPAATQIIDTQDLHSVRRARERVLKKNGTDWAKIQDFPLEECGEDLLRELSAFYRVDGVLVVSEWERDFLRDKIEYPSSRALFSPLFSEVEKNIPTFAERAHLCFLGNYRHAPNLDGIEWFMAKIWPVFHQKFPEVELHLYGAYPPAAISQRHKKMGIEAFGPVDNHRAMLKKYRALVAPLRFGAGIKGKVLESWSCGTPVIGTPIAFEGMGADSESFTDEISFISLFEKVHSLEANWTIEQNKFYAHAENFFSPKIRGQEFINFIELIQKDLTKNREADLTGQMLRHHSNNSTKYFSRWIEAKNKKADS